MVGQINSVLCYFSQVGAVPKLKLLKSYCSSLDGCELCNLFHAAISDVYLSWRKGLRREVYVESGRCLIISKQLFRRH